VCFKYHQHLLAHAVDPHISAIQIESTSISLSDVQPRRSLSANPNSLRILLDAQAKEQLKSSRHTEVIAENDGEEVSDYASSEEEDETQKQTKGQPKSGDPQPSPLKSGEYVHMQTCIHTFTHALVMVFNMR
jgi:hypothetical protein